MTIRIWTNIIAYALQIGLLVGVGAVLPSLMKIHIPRARLLYWQTLLVACLALPWLRPWHSEVIAVSSAPLVSVHSAPQVTVKAATSFEWPSPAKIALLLLLAGIAIRLITLALGFLKLRRYRRLGREFPLPPEWSGIAGHVTLLVSEQISGPVTFGLSEPVVLLPADFPSMSASMRDAILFHELLHVERRDWLFTFGEEILRAVFWFHPGIWWLLGEIQLAREQTVDQAVIEMTQARDPYVDTLLAMAGVTAELDLAPAPLFLRRRHLKQRVMGIVQESKMSTKRLVISQVSALAVMAAACWVIAGAIPLRAQAQTVVDAPGVTVNLNGAELMHRSAILYPAEALAKGVEGTVTVQVRLDANGEVTDDAILSGPNELRKSVQQAVLNWHFSKNGEATRVVNIDFVKPASVPTVNTLPALAQRQMPVVNANPDLFPQRVIAQIVINGLSDAARDELLTQLPVHVGDQWSVNTGNLVTQAVKRFDTHLVVSGHGAATGPDAGKWTINIETPESRAVFTPAVSVLPAPTQPGVQRIGGNVMAANLISSPGPVYPPLAKMARQQGTVRFDATISKEGTIEDLKVLPGAPPLLIQAAMEAVRTWVYKPVQLNGTPVSVATTIDVNFSLEGGNAAPLQ